MCVRVYERLGGSGHTRATRLSTRSQAEAERTAAGGRTAPAAAEPPSSEPASQPATVPLAPQENERAAQRPAADTMNGAVYISFFQGQLESVLEQVVQLAVQEISKTVGSGLNTLLLETAVKEQENRRLRLQLQAWENRAKSVDGPADGNPSPSKSKSERPDGKSPERQQQQQQHGPGGAAGAPSGLPTDIRRREQRRRAVGRQQLYNTHTNAQPQQHTHVFRGRRAVGAGSSHCLA